MEVVLAGTSAVLALASNYIFFVFALHTKLPNLPGSEFYVSSTQAIVKKYPINIYPAKPLVAVAWPGILLLNLAATVSVFWKTIFGRKCFAMKTYVFWIIQMIGTVLWTFTFDRELHMQSLLVLTVVFFSFLATFLSALTFTQTDLLKSTSDSRNHWSFNGIVTTYLGVVGSWIFITLAATTNYVIAYKDSASFAEAQQTGFCTTIDACGVCSLVLVILPQIIWTSFDFCFHSRFTSEIRTFYPSLSFFMFGIFLSNYKPKHGLSYSNLVSLFISGAAFITWMYQRSRQQTISDYRRPFRQKLPEKIC